MNPQPMVLETIALPLSHSPICKLLMKYKKALAFCQIANFSFGHDQPDFLPGLEHATQLKRTAGLAKEILKAC